MKKTTDTAFSETVETVENAEVEANATPAAPAVDTDVAAPDDNIYVYLGPTIGGLIQKGSIYHGKNKDDIPDLALAYEKIPKIKQLVVQDINIRSVQQKLNSAENNAYTIAEKAIAEAAKNL